MTIQEKIASANEKAVNCIINANPVWVDVLPASECVDGMEDYMILHSGPRLSLKICACCINVEWSRRLVRGMGENRGRSIGDSESR